MIAVVGPAPFADYSNAFAHFILGYFWPVAFLLQKSGCLGLDLAMTFVIANYSGPATPWYQNLVREWFGLLTAGEIHVEAPAAWREVHPDSTIKFDLSQFVPRVSSFDAWKHLASNFYLEGRYVSKAPCTAVQDVSAFMHSKHMSTSKKRRHAQLVLVIRKVHDKSQSGKRHLLNGAQVTTMLQDFCRRNQLRFRRIHLEELSAIQQFKTIASADILVALHGSALSLAGFQPPHSITVEVMPVAFHYCIFHDCLSHGGRVWIQATKDIHDMTEKEKGFYNKVMHGSSSEERTPRDIPRYWDPTNILHALDTAFHSKGSPLLDCTISAGHTGTIDEAGLKEWLANKSSGGKKKWCNRAGEESAQYCHERSNHWKGNGALQVRDRPLVDGGSEAGGGGDFI
jgi:hypothetical protein